MTSSPNRLFILGAGGFGRELHSWARSCPAWGQQWRFAGFLDDDRSALDGLDYEPGVVGGIEDFQPDSSDTFLCGIARPKTKQAVIGKIIQRGGRMASMIHPTAVVGANVQMGAGAVICPYSVITCDVRLGDYVSVNLHCAIGHDATVGDYTHLSSYCEINGRCEVGHHVYFGSHAFVIPGRTIGDHAMVGAGSVVIRSVRPGVTVFGNPAKRLMSSG